jgi:hypothetical protein
MIIATPPQFAILIQDNKHWLCIKRERASLNEPANHLTGH